MSKQITHDQYRKLSLFNLEIDNCIKQKEETEKLLEMLTNNIIIRTKEKNEFFNNILKDLGLQGKTIEIADTEPHIVTCV